MSHQTMTAPKRHIDFDTWINCIIQICRLQIQREHRRLVGESMTTLAEQIKAARAKLAEARQAAAHALTESADVTGALLREIEKTQKDTDDLRAELAGLTNGGPALDESASTPMPPRGYPA